MGIQSNTTLSAYLLVSHGSRDPRPQQAVNLLAQRVSEKMRAFQDRPLVGTAALELQALPLHQQIQAFGTKTLDRGIHTIQVFPLFLLAGVHVMEDIPAEVELAQAATGNLKIEIRPHIGIHPGLVTQLANLLKSSTVPSAWYEPIVKPNRLDLSSNGNEGEILVQPRSQEAWIVVSHGSRRPGGNQSVEAIATQLSQICQRPVTTAYWSIPPTLETQIEALVKRGYRSIGILPYFLFTGSITDAIAQKVIQLAPQFPHTELHLSEPIGVSEELASVVADLRLKLRDRPLSLEGG